MKYLSVIFMVLLWSAGSFSQTLNQQASEPKIKYKENQSVDFENLMIQGELRRAEIMVVTGNSNQGIDGLLRLRENFLDRMANDQGEEVK